MSELTKPKELTYKIHKCSSYSSNYLPQNIMVNNPTDQYSRWFTDNSTPGQYITLKLKSPAVVESIKFGKFMKAHVSDLKEFKIFGGMEENNLSLLLTAGLKNDANSEKFQLRHRTKEGFLLPVLFVEIQPLLSWGPAYNYTIWYVELNGINNPPLVQNSINTVDLLKEEESVRIILKHLQRHKYKHAFEALTHESGVSLEGPFQVRLWKALVENGNYEAVESMLKQAILDGEFDWYLSWRPYTPNWTQMSACSVSIDNDYSPPNVRPFSITRNNDICMDRESDVFVSECLDNRLSNSGSPEQMYSGKSSFSAKPGPRGGHQLVVDSTTGTLYLFGGWNGTDDLDDLWSFDVSSSRWTLLCDRSELCGGPSPRSCHKMVYDPQGKKLYTLGRYLNNAQRVAENLKSDMYTFDVTSNEWSLVSADTHSLGGPRLVFDHQMCIDVDARTIYVFGGRILMASSEEPVSSYSGLYAYYLSTGTWQSLPSDDLIPRVGHSMLFHSVERRLYIFAGQQNKEQLVDLRWYDIRTGECGVIASSSSKFNSCAGPPGAGFTQRATIDTDYDEIYVLSGLSKEKDRRVYNTLWVFSLKTHSCCCIYRNAKILSSEPRPRFAHQLVYDHVRKVHYLFGGNPGVQSPRLRLDDLWALRLNKPHRESISEQIKTKLRETRYKEMAACSTEDSEQAVEALRYLRKDVYEVIDSRNMEQVTHFHKLASVLFSGPESQSDPMSLNSNRVNHLRMLKADASPKQRYDLTLNLAAVLGSDDSCLEPLKPFEEFSPPTPDSWDIGLPSDEQTNKYDPRSARIQLYDHICQYFRPSQVPPPNNVEDLLHL